MSGTKTLKRIRDAANAVSDGRAALLIDAANKIELLITTLNSAKVAIASKQQQLLKVAQQDIDETLRSLDKDI